MSFDSLGQPPLLDTVEFNPTVPGPVIINGAPPVPAPKRYRKWVAWVGGAVVVLGMAGGWISAEMDAVQARDDLTLVANDREQIRGDLADAQRRLSANAATVDGLKTNLMEASNALSAASLGYDKAVRVNEATCKFIDSVFPLIPRLEKGDTVRLCESHTDTLRNWGSDAATASGNAANAGR